MKKTRVLVIGMTNILGGVETFIRNTYSKFNYDMFEVDYLHHSNDGILFENEFKKNGSNIFYCDKFLRHPIKAYKKIKKIIVDGKYDVIHCNACSANMIVYFLPALFIKNRPLLVMHSHNASSDKKIRHYVFRFILNRVIDIKFACSEKAGKWMYGKNKKFDIISNGIDIDKFKYDKDKRTRLRNKYNIKNDDIVLGSVGRLEKVKNHQFIINMMNKLPEKYKYFIVGEGSLKTELLKIIEENKLENRVFILNNSDTIYELYQMFDIFVMPSLFEGLPMVCVEAQVAGLPLILSDIISRDTKLVDNVKFVSLSTESEWINLIKSTILNSNRLIEQDGIFSEYDNKKVAIKIEEVFRREKRD